MLAVLVGLLAGVLAGMLGVGGGFVVVPFLAWGQTAAQLSSAVALGAVAVLPIVMLSALQHWAAFVGRPSERALVRQMLLPVALSAALAALIAALLPGRVLTGLFAVIVGAVALSGLFGVAPALLKRLRPVKRRWLPWLPPACIIGAGGGIIGAGGGYLAVPYLTVCRGQPVHLAIHQSAVLSLAAISGASVTAGVRILLRGGAALTVSTPELRTLACLILGGMIGVLIGQAVAARLPATRLKFIFHVYLLLLSAHMLVHALV